MTPGRRCQECKKCQRPVEDYDVWICMQALPPWASWGSDTGFNSVFSSKRGSDMAEDCECFEERTK